MQTRVVFMNQTKTSKSNQQKSEIRNQKSVIVLNLFEKKDLIL